MTYSIISFDPETKMIGSAIASKWLSVGAFIPIYRQNVGLVHAQSLISQMGAENCLNQIEKKSSLSDALQHTNQQDTKNNFRQYLICDSQGNFEGYTGDGVKKAHDVIIAKNCIAGGNMLQSKAAIKSMVNAYEENHKLSMAERLLISLEAAQENGGDKRGQESASLCIYDPNYPNMIEHSVNLRIDHHSTPLTQLRDLLKEFHSGDRIIA